MKYLSSLSRRDRRQCLEKLGAGLLILIGLAGLFASLDSWVQAFHLSK